MSHKTKLSYWLIPILCVSLCPLALIAQEKQEKKAEKAAHTQL